LRAPELLSLLCSMLPPGAELSSPHASSSIGQDRAMLCHDSLSRSGASCTPHASTSGSTLMSCPRATAKTQAPLCHHQATTTLHARPCTTGAESALSVPLLPCLSLPLPRARCSRQCQNRELHQSLPPNARRYAPKVISLGLVHFHSSDLWHVGSHSPF
jgi:hypothetical protein